MPPAMTLETRHAFSKRDNMGFAIPPALIILLIMLGAAFAVCCGYAATRFMFDDKPELKSRTAEQDDYMREVRSRNVQGLMAETARGYYRPRRSDYSTHPSESKS